MLTACETGLLYIKYDSERYDSCEGGALPVGISITDGGHVHHCRCRPAGGHIHHWSSLNS